MTKTAIFQIYYDEITKSKLLPGFIPLDNTKNERPDWFEFWPILNYLRDNRLEDDTWYGFLSPKFHEKTGYKSDLILHALETYHDVSDVAIFSTIGWDQLCYFLNPWEQGEVHHPGMISLTQKFLSRANIQIDLSRLVTDLTTSVFSNYIIAKKEYWLQWQKISESFFDYVENGLDNNPLSEFHTRYNNIENQYPMKTFIQERFSSLILAQGKFSILSPDQSASGQIFSGFLQHDEKTRKSLIACELLKGKYRETLDKEYLNMYWKIRKGIVFSGPNWTLEQILSEAA